MSEGIPLTAFASSTTANFLNDTAGEHGIQNVFNHSRSSDAERSEHRIPPGWKAEIYAVMEDPTSSTGAFIVHFFCTALIVISALVTVLETVPAFHSISPGIWFGLETTFVLLFTVEYVLRAVSRSNDWKVLLQWVLCEQTCQFAVTWCTQRNATQRSLQLSTYWQYYPIISSCYCTKIP